MINNYSKATEQQVIELEHLVGMYLPECYRKFLQNNITSSPILHRCPINNGIGEDSIDIFYSINQLNKSFEYWGDPNDVGYIAIGLFRSNNALLMSMKEHSFGEVFYWDNADEEIEPPTFNNLAPVAISFEELVDSLHG